MQGGMYNILEIIINIKFQNNVFTCKELSAKVDLSHPAITNNISRLVEVGFLEQEDYRDEKGYKRTRYRLTENAIEFVNNFLHK